MIFPVISEFPQVIIIHVCFVCILSTIKIQLSYIFYFNFLTLEFSVEGVGFPLYVWRNFSRTHGVVYDGLSTLRSTVSIIPSLLEIFTGRSRPCTPVRSQLYTFFGRFALPPTDSHTGLDGPFVTSPGRVLDGIPPLFTQVGTDGFVSFTTWTFTGNPLLSFRTSKPTLTRHSKRPIRLIFVPYGVGLSHRGTTITVDNSSVTGDNCFRS